MPKVLDPALGYLAKWPETVHNLLKLLSFFKSNHVKLSKSINHFAV